MKKYLLYLLIACIANTGHAQVGIGTSTPSPNSALDITSANKGLLLPRVGDTALVNNPSAGLLIYNMNTKSPAYHNGTRWTSLSATAGADVITYTITNAALGFTNGTFNILNVSHGLAATGSAAANFQSISFTKALDINSTGFAKAVATGTTPGSASMVIEIKFFTQGSASPYYSLKATNIRVGSYNIVAGIDSPFNEQISISPIIYGYKDWVNNLSFGWNVGNNAAVSY